MPRTVIEEGGDPAVVDRGYGPVLAAGVLLVLAVLGLFLFFGMDDDEDADTNPGREPGVTSSEAPSDEPADEPTSEETSEPEASTAPTP